MGVITCNNVRVNLNTHGLYVVHMGVGLGWGNNVQVHVNLNTCTYPSCFALGSFPLHLHTYVMLACHALSCYIYIDILTFPLEVQLSKRCTSTYQTFANHGVLETTDGTNNLLLNKTILKLHTSVSCSCSNDMPHLMRS